MKLLLENWRKFLKEELIVPTINMPNLIIYDFDETIAQSEGFIIARHKETGEEQKITTQEEYDQLKVTEEYDFDFSNLSKITDPVEIVPITKKLRSDLRKPNTQVMILTARQPEAEDEIQIYLDSIQIDPVNMIIIGCSGCDKGQFIENLMEISPQVKNIIFYDDSQENIQNLLRSRDAIGDILETFEIVDVSDPINWRTL